MCEMDNVISYSKCTFSFVCMKTFLVFEDYWLCKVGSFFMLRTIGILTQLLSFLMQSLSLCVCVSTLEERAAVTPVAPPRAPLAPAGRLDGTVSYNGGVEDMLMSTAQTIDKFTVRSISFWSLSWMLISTNSLDLS